MPIDMESSGAGINKAQHNVISPALSPDGKYLFFNRHSFVLDPDIYWVSTNILVGLKKTVFAPKLSNQIPVKSIKADTVFNYIIPGNTFSCEYGTDSLRYSASLSNGSALPSWLHFDAQTRTLSGTATQAEIDTIKITATNKDTVSASCSFALTVTNPTGIDEDNDQLPNEFNLHQNYPNPFNPSTVISYQLATSSNVKLTIYNMLGQKIKTLVNSYQSAGEHTITWNATDNSNNPVSSGVYFYSLTSDASTVQKKMILLR